MRRQRNASDVPTNQAVRRGVLFPRVDNGTLPLATIGYESVTANGAHIVPMTTIGSNKNANNCAGISAG